MFFSVCGLIRGPPGDKIFANGSAPSALAHVPANKFLHIRRLPHHCEEADAPLKPSRRKIHDSNLDCFSPLAPGLAMTGAGANQSLG